MSKVLLGTLLAVLTIPLPARADGEEVPADRVPLTLPAPPATGEDTPGASSRPADPALDAGRTEWSRSTEAQHRRDDYMELTGAAFGAAGAFAGLGASFFLVSLGQQTGGLRAGWQTAAWVAGGLSAAALVTGTVLWIGAPDDPVRAAVVPDGLGVRLALRF